MLFGTARSMSFCFCFCTLLSLPLKCCNGIILETMCGTYWTFSGVPQAIIHHAFDALDDIMGCCLRCMVPGASDSATWWDTHWICWKVGLIQQVFSVSNFSLFPIHIHSAVFAVAGCSLPLPHRDSLWSKERTLTFMFFSILCHLCQFQINDTTWFLFNLTGCAI